MNLVEGLAAYKSRKNQQADVDPMSIVAEGLQQILDTLKKSE